MLFYAIHVENIAINPIELKDVNSGGNSYCTMCEIFTYIAGSEVEKCMRYMLPNAHMGYLIVLRSD